MNLGLGAAPGVKQSWAWPELPPPKAHFGNRCREWIGVDKRILQGQQSQTGPSHGRKTQQPTHKGKDAKPRL